MAIPLATPLAPPARLAVAPSTSGRPPRPPLPARPARRTPATLRPRSLFRGGGGGGGLDPDSLLFPGGGGGGGGSGDDEDEPPSSLLSPRRRPLEVESIPRPILERVEAAVEGAGGRVTAGDVAAAAGVPLRTAEATLNALAADTSGRLQVAPSGDLAYVLPPNFRSILRSKSAWLRLAPRIDAAANAVGWAGRVAFGGALLASLALAAAALVALSVAAQSSSDDRDRRGGRGYGGGGGLPVSFWVSPSDFLFWFDPYGYRRARRSVGGARGGGRGNAVDPAAMGFLESVFSFVFGDGDPNVTYDADRWRAAGRAIAARGGVATAEELAPFLDLPSLAGAPARDADGDGADDEAWVLPALVRFNGRAEVDEAGRLLYVFPDLQKTAGGRGGGGGGGWGAAVLRGREVVAPSPPPPALEAPIPFTRASPGQRLAAAALGAANIAAVSALASALAQRGAAAALAAQGFGFVLPLLPWLQAYAAAFFLIPAVRWLWNGRLNAAIATRNDARSQAANALRAPSRALAGKLGAARARAETVALRPEEAVFDSGASTAPEAVIASELADFDKKLGGGGR